MRQAIIWALLCSVLLCGCTTFDKGSQALARGDYPTAVELLEEAAEEHPTHIKATRNLGKAYFYAGRPEDARRTFLGILEQAPGDWYATYYLGLILVSEGKQDKGFDMIESISIPFKFYMKKEIECSAQYVRKKNFPPDEAVREMEKYFDIAQQRQWYRDSPSLNRDRRQEYECPPFLRRYPY